MCIFIHFCVAASHDNISIYVPCFKHVTHILVCLGLTKLVKQNVLLTSKFEAKICDFGTAQHLPNGAQCPRLRGLSPLYAAPEVVDSQSGTCGVKAR